MPEDMTVMVIDGGARGHVLSEAYEKDPRVKRVIVAPGNDFIGHRRDKEVIVAKNCSLKDPASLLTVAHKHGADLVDVAQDDALALGTVDLMQDSGFMTFGASRAASEIEWDKLHSREFMKRHGIPSTDFIGYDTNAMPDAIVDAKEYARIVYEANPDELIFVKAVGLAAGEGALSCRSREEAWRNIDRMKSFGNAGKRFVVERGICNEDGTLGEEFSYTVISDGITYRAFKPAQDNKLA